MSVTFMPQPRRAADATGSPATGARVGHAERAGGVISTLAFALLGLYGALRWGTMLRPDPSGRLLGLVGLSLVVLALGAVRPVRRLPVAALVGAIGLLVVVALAGLPLEWVTHLRLAVLVRAVGNGLSALPGVLVPYQGLDQSVREVIVMGAGVLLLDGALMLAFAPRSLGDLRPAVAALPLIVLAAVPSALARPSLAYIHGVVLFGLLAALVWGDRLAGARGGAALLLVLVVGAAGAVLAPALDTHRPWLDFQKLTSRLAGSGGERFNWSQRYEPLDWPRDGHEVLRVRAGFRADWKAEDLDGFNGYGWIQDSASQPPPLLGVSAASLRRWTQTLQVSLTGMSSSQVVAAGVAAQPAHVREGALPGASPGTWTAGATLRPGDAYDVRVYTPQPTRAQLRAAGSRYPGPIALAYLGVELPSSAPGPPVPVDFPPYASSTPSAFGSAAVVQASPYGPVYRLAQRLRTASTTPYDFALAVERYLAHGYRYDESPPSAAYPLVTFLLHSHRGYCQQFAGAMALLLRMGGVPARVAAGFTPGAYERRHEYSVSDIDAHAWVEAWFPGYGWVSFDPTPPADPALGGGASTPAIAATALPHPGVGAGGRAGSRGAASTPAATLASAAGRGRGGGLSWPWFAGGGALLAVFLGAGVWGLAARSLPPDPLEELERAFRRGAQPLGPGTTLAALEDRLSGSADAAGYVRALRLARYAGAGEAIDAVVVSRGRRALRAELAGSRSVPARLRALWALPPAASRARPRIRRDG